MVWHDEKKDWLGRTVKKKVYEIIKENGKKIKEPNMKYFGGGMHAMDEPAEDVQNPIQLAEIYPTSGIKSKTQNTVVTNRTRAIELWKEPKSEQVRIILGAQQGEMKFFTNSLNLVNYDHLEQTEPVGRPDDAIQFDIEVSKAFNFSPMLMDNTDFLEMLISTISNMSYAWIQILFVRDDRINDACSIHLNSLYNEIKDITKGKTDFHASVDRNFIPKYNTVHTPSDKQVPEFMRTARPDYEQRVHENLCAMSIRGIIAKDEHGANLKTMQSLAEHLRSKQDRGLLITYKKYPYFDQYMKSRTMYDDNAIQQLYDNKKMWKDGLWGRGRDMVPFFCLNADELIQIACHMPYTETLPVRYNRAHFETLPQERSGCVIGTDSKDNQANIKYGQMVPSSSHNTVYDLDDLTRHTYVLGASGCGKTTMLLNIYLHMINAMAAGRPGVYIGIDSKENDTFEFVKRTIPGINVILLDINKTDFGINLLELPEYKHGERSVTVSFMVDHVLSMFKEFYQQTQQYVQMERLLKLLLQLLYHNADSPTLADMYRLVMTFKKDGAMERIKRSYRIPNREFIQALESAATLRDDAWNSILNRIEPFVTDEYLRRHFGVRKSKIKFGEMLKPNTVILIRISDAETPEIAHRVLLMSMVSKIWYAVKKRAVRTSSEERIPVILALDEFQRIGDMGLIATLMAQARSFGMGVILAHQNSAQISKPILDGIMGNCSTMIFGRLSGSDASKIALMVDPALSEKLRNSLAGLADHAFYVKQRSPDGHEPGMPVYTNSLPPPPVLLSNVKVDEIYAKCKAIYGIKSKDLEENLEYDQIQGGASKWKVCCSNGLPFEIEWQVIMHLMHEKHILLDITRGIKAMTRDAVTAALTTLQDSGFVEHILNSKVQRSPLYGLTDNGIKAYVDLDYNQIGSAPDTPLVAQQAVDYYRKKGWFVSLAHQSAQKGQNRPDFVAYDYSVGMAVSVEIESITEVQSHPEHVLFNMRKWIELGFDECHVWSANGKIVNLREEVDEGYERIRTFVVDLPADYEPKKYIHKKPSKPSSKTDGNPVEPTEE